MKNLIENPHVDWLDWSGACVSWMCVAHCLALPFVVALLPFLGLAFLLDERVEWTIGAVSILIAAASLLPAYFHRHGKIRPVILFLCGIILIVISHLTDENYSTAQIPFLLFGAILITAGHSINRRLCRDCDSCRTI